MIEKFSLKGYFFDMFPKLGQSPGYMARFCLLSIIQMMATSVSAAEAAKLAVASSLAVLMDGLQQDFSEETGFELKFSLGASRTLARQINAGAPYGLFLSADSVSLKLLQTDLVHPESQRVYGYGRLGLFVPIGSPLSSVHRLSDLPQAVNRGQLRKLAIAHPDNAPYGLAAKQALQKAGLWQLLEKRLVISENAAQAAYFALQASDAALLPEAILLAERVQKAGRYNVLASHLYNPIEHSMLLTKRANPAARAFYQFMLSASAKSHLVEHGIYPTAE